MTEGKRHTRSRPQCDLAKRVESRARLKLARGKYVPNIWMGLGMAGIVGWSIILPTILGTALGVWLDNHAPSSHSWTLMFLITGLFIGCVNASYWVSRENDAIRKAKERERREEENHD